MKTRATLPILLCSVLLTGCGSDNNAQSDTQGDVQFRVTFAPTWNGSNFPTQYPSSAHWSPLVGTVHNEQVTFWEVNGQPASDGIETMAETGGTGDLAAEINTAQESGYSQGTIKASGISSGSGSASIEFATSDQFPLLTMVSMIAPIPDWFIGVSGLELQDGNGDWIDSQTVDLALYDAGTDLGVRFESNNSDSNDQNLPITLLTSDRSDTDFENGIHFESGVFLGTLTVERIE